jgi:hypothetical protein
MTVAILLFYANKTNEHRVLRVLGEYNFGYCSLGKIVLYES